MDRPGADGSPAPEPKPAGPTQPELEPEPEPAPDAFATNPGRARIALDRRGRAVVVGPIPPPPARPIGGHDASPPERPLSGAAEPVRAPEPLPEPDEPPLPGYLDPPSARTIVGRGFDLAARASADLRPAGLMMSLQFLATVGPFILFLVVVLFARPELAGELVAASEPGFADSPFAPAAVPSPAVQAISSMLVVLGIVATLGLVAVVVESEAIAIAMLAGRATGRPLPVGEALVRSRQVFWTLIGAGLLVGVPLTIVNWIAGLALIEAIGPTESATLTGSFVAALLGLPFSYLATAIVLGDVGIAEAIRRSIRLFAARRKVALVLGAYALVINIVIQFGGLAGGDLLFRIGDVLGLGFEGSLASTLATLAIVLLAIMALGSLVFTANAIVASPQVVAFVGLTHVALGLDQARRVVASEARPPATLGPPSGGVDGPLSPWERARRTGGQARWLSTPMALLMIAGPVLFLVGLAAVARFA